MTRRFRVTIGGVTYNVDVEELSQPGVAPAHGAAPAPAAATGSAAFPPAAPAPSGAAAFAPAAPAAAAPAPATSAASNSASSVSAVSAPAAAPAPSPAPAGAASTVEGQAVCAPLPGMIVSVPVQVGQQVREGDVVAVLEAMKMENDITTPYAGTVKQVLVSKGASVAMNDPLVVIG